MTLPSLVQRPMSVWSRGPKVELDVSRPVFVLPVRVATHCFDAACNERDWLIHYC